MSAYVIVFVNDDMQASVYGTPTGKPYRSLPAALDRCRKMDRDLETDRDEAGGGAGHVGVHSIIPEGKW